MSHRSLFLEILEDRITPAPVFAALNLNTDLDGTNGFQVLGTGVSGVNVEISAVANAGDVNGDGIKDFLLGIPLDSNANRGRAALVFGKAGGFPADIDLDALNGSNGVLITGQADGDKFGTAVSGLGDVNGDGFDDFVVGAPGNDAGTPNSERGAAYVVFGKPTWSTGTLALNTLTGTTGFKIVGAPNQRTGLSGIGQAVGGFNLAGTGAGGDFNGDGFADILVGAPDVRAFSTGATDSGAAFIIFGKDTSTTGFASPFSVATLNGTNGLMIGSSQQSDFMGTEVGFVGDVNGDGLTDLSLGNHTANGKSLSQRRSFIIFGKQSGNPATLDVDTLTADQGFAGLAFSNKDFVGPLAYGSEFVMRDIDNDGDQDLGVSFVHDESSAKVIQGYTFVRNTGTGYTANPFGNLSKEVRQALYGFGNASIEQTAFDLGDFNGDGFYDIGAYPSSDVYFPNAFFGRAPTKTYYANNDKDSKGISFTGLTIPLGTQDPRVQFIGDISGDGIDDALILPAPGTGTAAAPNAYVVFGNAINPSADGKTVIFKDIDGDTVTVKTSAGALTKEMFTVSHPAGAVQNGQQLDLLDLTVGDANSDAAFARANLTISVKKSAMGDGRVNVGAINATGIDLGNVVIAGGLGSIDAGNGADPDNRPGLNKLDVYRFGGVGVPSSDVVGRIGSIIVDTTFLSARLNVTGGATEGIGSISVVGDFSGILDLTGPLGTFKAANLLTGTNIDADGTSTKKTAITAKSIANGALIDVATIVSKLTATQVGTATLTASRFDTISITGDTKVSLPGSFAGSVFAVNGVGTMTVKENFSGSLNLIGATATLGSFKASDLLGTALINVDGLSTKKTSITARVINDNVTIDVGSTIARLTAARIGDATINADRIDSLSVNGDTKLGIAGNLAADITLDNAGSTDATIRALGTVKIAGRLEAALITVAGSVGTFSAGAMLNARLFAGYTPTNPGQILAGGTFLTGALLGTFTITGKSDIGTGIQIDGKFTAMDDSFVVATRLGTVSVSSLDDETGTLGWGFAFKDGVKSLKVKSSGFAYSGSGIEPTPTKDFTVRPL